LKPSLHPVERSAVHTALRHAMAARSDAAALDLLHTLSWADTAALLKEHGADTNNNSDSLVLTQLLLAHFFTLHAPAALKWVMAEAPPNELLAWLNPYLTYWKKQQPVAFQAWLTHHFETLRPIEPDNPIWKSWQSSGPREVKPPLAAAAAPLPSLESVMETLESGIRDHDPDSAPLKAWGLQSGHWREAMNYADGLRDPERKDQIRRTVSNQWIQCDFPGWAQWVDQQPAKRHLPLYQDSLFDPAGRLHGAFTRRSAPEPGTDALIANFLQPTVIGKIIAVTGHLAQPTASIHLVEAWLLHDPPAAAAWLAGQPDAPWQNGLKEQRADRLESDDPAAALALAASITNPGRRTKTMSRIYQTWSRKETEAAAAFVEEHYPSEFPSP
jgi:hypothetical protein